MNSKSESFQKSGNRSHDIDDWLGNTMIKFITENTQSSDELKRWAMIMKKFDSRIHVKDQVFVVTENPRSDGTEELASG